MKKLIIIILAAVILTCEKNLVQPENNTGILFIEIENHFDNDLVQLALDAKTLLNDRITTNYSINLAWATEKHLPKDWHIIEVTLPEIPRHEIFAFELSDTLTVLIRYNTDIKDFEIETTKIRFLRD